jgi:hypothetical protein
MAPRTTPAKAETAPVDPFAGLLETAEVSEKRTHVDRSDIVVPAEWIAKVEWAYENSKRVTLKVTDKETFTNVANLIRAAADKSEKNVTATCVAKYDVTYKRDDKGEIILDTDNQKVVESETLVGLTFTVGNRRGVKKDKGTASADVAK